MTPVFATASSGWALVGDLGRVAIFILSALVVGICLPLVRYRWGEWRRTRTATAQSLLLIDAGILVVVVQEAVWAYYRVGDIPLWYGLPLGISWQVLFLVGLWKRRHLLRKQVGASGDTYGRRRHDW